MKPYLAVIDYDAGNLHSVLGATERAAAAAGVEIELAVCRDSAGLAEADGVILPGVGSFAAAMERLEERGLADGIRTWLALGKPLLGICLGMQLLFTEGLEGGSRPGFGLFPGAVRSLPDDVKRPHMGWNRVVPTVQDPWLPAGSRPFYAYFAHSFAAEADGDHVIATINYGPHRLAAAARRGKVMGVQFHPERSGAAGLALLQNFMSDSFQRESHGPGGGLLSG